MLQNHSEKILLKLRFCFIFRHFDAFFGILKHFKSFWNILSGFGQNHTGKNIGWNESGTLRAKFIFVLIKRLSMMRLVLISDFVLIKRRPNKQTLVYNYRYARTVSIESRKFSNESRNFGANLRCVSRRLWIDRRAVVGRGTKTSFLRFISTDWLSGKPVGYASWK